MVYFIRPHANHANYMIDLSYETPPGTRGWMDYARKHQPVAQESAPVLILSERPTPLPDAFEISRDWWCVSAQIRERMQRLFGSSQVTFYEVPARVKESGAFVPSTNFVTFSQFFELIDWYKSKISRPKHTELRPEIEVIHLADVPKAAVFKATPKDREIIWIEQSFRRGNRLFSPGFNVYATDGAAEEIGQAFPGAFILRKHQETSVPTTA